MSSLAILILTKNEEDNIVDVVRNAKTCTDEVVIIDSGSTDRTVELAEQEGAKVAFRAWDGDFSAQRNFALSQTEADWVLYVDADERITPALGEAIRDIVQHGSLDKQYSIKRKSVAFGVTFNHGVLNPDHVLRMFPRNTVTWVHKVHEHPECPLPKETLPGYFEHYAYTDWHEWEEKLCYLDTAWAVFLRCSCCVKAFWMDSWEPICAAITFFTPC